LDILQEKNLTRAYALHERLSQSNDIFAQEELDPFDYENNGGIVQVVKRELALSKTKSLAFHDLRTTLWIADVTLLF
jgi:hypothetical protein